MCNTELCERLFRRKIICEIARLSHKCTTAVWNRTFVAKDWDFIAFYIIRRLRDNSVNLKCVSRLEEIKFNLIYFIFRFLVIFLLSSIYQKESKKKNDPVFLNNSVYGLESECTAKPTTNQYCWVVSNAFLDTTRNSGWFRPQKSFRNLLSSNVVCVARTDRAFQIELDHRSK